MIMSINKEKVILNTIKITKLAADVIYYLSREAQNEYRRQSRVTKYFDKIEDRETVNQNTRNVNNDVAMDGSGESRRDHHHIKRG
jgi:uncharacterized protein (DUF1810 family)